MSTTNQNKSMYRVTHVTVVLAMEDVTRTGLLRGVQQVCYVLQYEFAWLVGCDACTYRKGSYVSVCGTRTT